MYDSIKKSLMPESGDAFFSFLSTKIAKNGTCIQRVVVMMDGWMDGRWGVGAAAFNFITHAD